ncbi:MAG: MarR family transcriptional regulator [Shimia sp.]|nr:MarR family transcriptional regulator [Shimia sp.]MCP4824811.1 MarR family transcriptional regulator [Shimia sp.]
MTKDILIRELIVRLARLNASQTWHDDLNPAQVSALKYLSRANRFSRSPSHVADYLGTTRGTMSQTLKALDRKGYVSENRSETDKRSISYDLTQDGTRAALHPATLDPMLSDLPEDEQKSLEQALTNTLISLLKKNGSKAFGVCKTCRHHQQKQNMRYCNLLQLPLETVEADQICHEQVPA